ncbi:AlwI family type II restriction endonuclease [Aggregatibacter actinomycetemcomitans]|nr:AlwI family type II restriction endonuclease [Aggregatibacter actinomycetemcomitans]MBN6087623.1 AlwI family type II restriction endonuclease [Aggregatibacter actinomycetemcomitans]
MFSKKVVAEKEDFGLYDLIDIDDLLIHTPSIDSISRELKDKYNIQLETRQDIDLHMKNEKINKLEKLIDTRFDNETIIKLLDCFYERGDSDKKIKAEITDNANIPTLFEYILAIAWHKINGRKGNLLEAMNLSLDIDMLPKSHASGGQADLVFKYEANDIIPKHQLLLEATLSDSTTQRRMELEPVSRHLWHVMKENNCQDDYAILVSTNIYPSVISDFRGRKSMEMTFDGKYFIDGMKILPINTKMIQFMLANNMIYEQVYQILDKAHNSKLGLRENWYEKSITQYFQ